MKFTKKEIAKTLATTPNVMATAGELVQFFRSKQYNPEEEHEGNHVEDFLVFRGELDADIIDASDWVKFNVDRFPNPTELKLPKKVIKQLDDEYQDLLKFDKEFDL